MPVKIEQGTKVGNNNAIGDNASVNITKNNTIENTKEIHLSSNPDTTTPKKTWFGKHPWLSGIICSLIASIIMLLNWSFLYNIIEKLFM